MSEMKRQTETERDRERETGERKRPSVRHHNSSPTELSEPTAEHGVSHDPEGSSHRPLLSPS